MVDPSLEMRSNPTMWKFHQQSKLYVLVDNHHSHRRQDDEHRPSERPLLAIPFKWEASPGIAKIPSNTGYSISQSRDLSSQHKSLAPPPHFQKLNSPHSIPSSPRSPRSISLSKKMKSLLQGKKFSRQQQRCLDDSSSYSSVDGCSQPTSPKFESPKPDPGFLPFQQVSNMLLDVWYGGDSFMTSPCESSSSELDSPASSISTDNSSSSFSGEYSDSRHEFEFEDDDDYSKDLEALLQHKLLKSSDRFRVEASNSASLLADSPRRHKSALKKPCNIHKVVKKVRFAILEDQDDEEEHQETVTGTRSPPPPVLSRYSSRPASRYEQEHQTESHHISLDRDCESEEELEFNPSPRPKRDLAELVMHIIQTDSADFAAARRHQKSSFKMFQSSSSSSRRW